MRRVLVAGLTGLALLILVSRVDALIAFVPLQQRIAQSDVVVTGKVLGADAKPVQAERFPGDKQGGEFQVLNVKVEEGFLGGKGLKEVKVGVLMPPKPVPPKPGEPIRPRLPFRGPGLSLEHEGLLLLTPHHKEKFFVLSGFQSAIDKKSDEYKQGIAEAQRLGKLLADPVASLKAKEGEERFQVAALLLSRYRAFRQGPTHEVALPAEESKLILRALADADWDTARTGRQQMTPQQTFFMLRLGPKDGWTQPQNFRDVPVAARNWLRANADTFKLTRVVAGAADK